MLLRNENALFFWIGILLTLLLVHCKSTKPGVDGLILEHQQQVTQLEDRNQELERRIAQYDDAVGRSVEALTAIRERSLGMEGTVDELISLFDEYQRRVNELARAFDQVKAGINNSE